MRRIVRYVLLLLCVALLLTGATAGYYLFWKGRVITPLRPDLVRLPDGAPAAPRGFPTMLSAYAAWYLGLVETLDIATEWPIPAGVSVKKDVEYGRVGDRALLLDLYSPEKMPAPAPGLIFIHGGGWQAGTTKDYSYYTLHFAQRGYVAASMTYRFSQEAGFPACVEDAKCAVRWMRAHAQEIHVDPDRIAVIGGSAGGYLSMMVGYSPEVAEWNSSGGYEGVSSAVAAVVDLYGPPDLTETAARGHETVTSFLKTAFYDTPVKYVQASPIFHLDAHDPPTMVIHGTLDDIVPVEYSDKLVERLKALGVPYRYARVDGWPHTMDIARPMTDYVLWLLNAFFEEHLQKKTS